MKIFITGGSGFIGTNLCELFAEKKYSFLNFDKNTPLNPIYKKYWYEGNILDKNSLAKVLNEFKPSIIIHLAAKTDTLGLNMDYYVDNTQGTENLLIIANELVFVERVIITSTQYVFFPKKYNLPKNDYDYCTHTIYGDSKVITEKLTKTLVTNKVWTIIRPTNVWGPWHIRYSNELLKYIKSRKYFHPGYGNIEKSYAYVKTVTNQIEKIMLAKKDLIQSQVFYVGDNTMDSYKWANEFSLQLTGKKLIRIPNFIFLILGLLGDLLKLIGVNFPLSYKRYKNMTTEYLTPMGKTIILFGTNNKTFKNNVNETINWLKNEGSFCIDTDYNI